MAPARRPAAAVEAYLRVIDEPVLRLTSVDLQCSADIRTIAEIFDFAQDYLGLLKAAIIASGLIPSGLEGSTDLSNRFSLAWSANPAMASKSSARSTEFPKDRGSPSQPLCWPA